ncbi:MAG: 2Fe-2S iron-sulfur cluster-binding protein [Hyphomicrobiaceae bacterium]|nr:2Fe-2S iron-sulfur cluster-binding protein [Hyphomicrobiaceae bacterium]
MHEFVPLTVSGVKHETGDAVVVSFDVPPEHAEAFRFRPGQHLALRTTLAVEEIRRTYSICSGPGAPLSIAIKRIEGGAFSNWANDNVHPGMAIESLPPGGRFVLPETPGEHRHVLAFAAGSGITPIIAMAEHAMLLQPGMRFTLVYGNRDTGSILFRERLEDLKDRFVDRLTLIHVLSRDEEGDAPLLAGRITGEKVAAFAGHLFHIDDLDHVFLCGPGSMIRDARNALLGLGLPRDRVHHEFFAAGGGAYRAPPSAPVSAPGAAVSGTEIVAILDGSRHRFMARPGDSIVDAALRAGIRAPYACKGGMCSTCRARLIEGDAPMVVNYSLEPWELDKGFVLSCQAVPTGNRIVVDFDQM